MVLPPTDRYSLTAKDIMVTKLITLRPEMEVYEAVDLLLHHRISGASVIEPDGTLVGVLSEKDCIANLVHAFQDDLPSIQVTNAMTTRLTVVQEDTPLLTVAHYFTRHRLRRLPVVRNGKLVGQISRRDVLKAISEHIKGQRRYTARTLYVSAVRDGAGFNL